jgi:hypothetical protein
MMMCYFSVLSKLEKREIVRGRGKRGGEYNA